MCSMIITTGVQFISLYNDVLLPTLENPVAERVRQHNMPWKNNNLAVGSKLDRQRDKRRAEEMLVE